MNNEKQRIAIAEACGILGPFGNRWIKEYEKEGGDAYGFTGFENGELVFIPDYLNDLNAMREAEKVFEGYGMRQSYRRNLLIACDTNDLSEVISATAAQRAEAFLRTIGKGPQLTLQRLRSPKRRAEHENTHTHTHELIDEAIADAA